MILRLGSIAWFAGIVAAALGFAAYWPALIITGAAFAAGTALGGKVNRGLFVAFVCLLALAAVARFEATRPLDEPGGIALLNGAGEVRLQGTIDAEPEERETTQRLRLHVEAWQTTDGSWQATEGRVLVTARLYPEFAYGDQVELSGEIETPPVFESFDYRDYLARQGVVSLSLYPRLDLTGAGGGNRATRVLISLRDRLSEGIAVSLPEPEAALAQGILLGRRSAIPEELSDDFNRAGISHLVAISGYNVMLLAGFTVGSLAWLLGRRRAVLCAMVIIVLYAALVGGSPSVLRATAMGLVMLGATLAGRPGNSLGAVGLVAALLTLAQPQIVEDVAFQLSVAATLGIVILARPLQDYIEARLPRRAPAAILAEHVSVTLAATLAVLPLIAVTFGRVSLIALGNNLLAVPAFPVVLLTSFVAAVVGAIAPELGEVIGAACSLPLSYTVAVGHTGASLPIASISVGGFGAVEALLAYAALGSGTFALLRHRIVVLDTDPLINPFKPGLRGAGVVAGFAAVVWWSALSPSGSRLEVTVLDVGQGDAVLVETPAGHRILVDGGPSGSRLLQELGAALPDAERNIDLVVLTHPQDDHLTGLVTLLDRYQVGAVLMGPNAGETGTYRAWSEALEAAEVPTTIAVAGQRVELGEGVYFDVLAPYEQPVSTGEDLLNEDSVVLRLVYGEVSFLLTGDIGAAGEEALLNNWGDIDATVLKVAHHGSGGSSTPAFLDAVRPEIAVISAGEGNSFGHPAPGTRLRLAGSSVLRTDLNGRVRFRSDGERLWVDWQTGKAELLEPAAATN